MTNLVDRALGGAGVRLHKYFYVGDVFVYTFALSMPILKKKIFAHSHCQKNTRTSPEFQCRGGTMSAKRDFFQCLHLLKFQNLCFLSLVFKLISNTNNFLLLFGFELKLFHLTTNKYNIFLDWIYRGHFLLKCISVCMVIFDTIAYKSFWRLLLLNQYHASMNLS